MPHLRCDKCNVLFAPLPYEERMREQFEAPPPRWCPNCRRRRRLAAINQLHLFRRRCDATGGALISNFPPEAACPTYSQQFWYGDGWTALAYGREMDFSRPFFPQFAELQRAVPRPLTHSNPS